MNSQKHRADGDHEDYDAEEDGTLVGHYQPFILMTGWHGACLYTNQTVHDKDAVINADTEDEGGDDNVDKVELHIEECHHAEHHKPADKDGCKAQQSVSDVKAEADKQHQEDEGHGQPLQDVEVRVQLQQRVGGVVIGVKHHEVRLLADGIADASVVAV